MNLASAYPNSALSVVTMLIIAFVVFGAIAAWIGLVFLADRTSSPQEAREKDSYLAVVAPPDVTAQDEHSEAGSDQARHGRTAA